MARDTASARRYLFYSHDGLGLGHARRNLAIATALVERDPAATILLATSVDQLDALGVPERVDILKLPSLRKVANGQYAARHLVVGDRRIRRLRAGLLESAVRELRPAVMLVDKHPLGAQGELTAALDALHSQGGRAVLGLRDILDEPAEVISEWRSYDIARVIAQRYERVVVYGQREVFDAGAEYDLPDDVVERMVFSGYVAGPAPTRRERPVGDRPLVLATCGGGEDGHPLISSFLRAARGAPWTGIAVLGPYAGGAHRARLQGLADRADVSIHSFVPDLVSWFPGVEAIVTMGGYNTLVEAVRSGTPTVCVPRTTPRREQLVRARAFERLGLVSVLDPGELTPELLGSRIDEAIARPHLGAAAQGSALDLGGSDATARVLFELARAPVRPGVAVA